MKKLIAIASATIFGAASVSSTLAASPEPVSSVDLIAWGHANGITKFDTWSEFNASAPVTREQAAKMITTWIGSHHELNWGMSEETCAFSDTGSMDATLVYSIESACTYGLFKGHKGAFLPKNYITRSDVQGLIERALDKLPASYEAFAKNIPSLSSSLLQRGELLTALYHINTIVEGQIATQKEEMLSTVSAKMNTAQQLWDSKNVNNYVVKQQHSCFCTLNSTHPIQFEVKNDTVVTGSLEDINETDKLPASQLTANPMTVEDAFALIQDAIDKKADSITVEYDAKLGNPTKINIDYSTMMADEETYYTYNVTEL